MLAGALVAMPGGTPASAATPKDCRVRNTEAGRTFTTLQQAVDAARRGERLTVRGTCLGGTVIDKSLVIEGVRAHPGRATLRGGWKVRVLRVVAGATVRIESLTIRRGNHAHGGGILNLGDLSLRHVVVRSNGSPGPVGTGTAIYNSGSLSLDGGTTVRDNSSDGVPVHNVGVLTMGDRSSIRGHVSGSLSNRGTVTMNDASRIAGNWVGVQNRGSLTLNGSSSIVRNGSYQVYGGGVWNGGSLTLNDSSTIRGNGAGRTVDGVGTPGGFGGGVYNRGTLTMTGASTIIGNSVFPGSGTIPPGEGGGVYNAVGGSLVGVTCGPDGNVRDNMPDDCHAE
jgi:hypothetical protein